MTRARVIVTVPQQVAGAIELEEPIPFKDSAIMQLAPSVPIGHGLGVTFIDDIPKIWGFAHGTAARIATTVSVEILDPGRVRVDVAPWRPFAVLDGQSNVTFEDTGPDFFANFLWRTLQKTETIEEHHECFVLAESRERF